MKYVDLELGKTTGNLRCSCMRGIFVLKKTVCLLALYS